MTKVKYGNGCCRGFTPPFPYPRIIPSSSIPDNEKNSMNCVYSFYVSVLYHIFRQKSMLFQKKPCQKIRQGFLNKLFYKNNYGMNAFFKNLTALEGKSFVNAKVKSVIVYVVIYLCIFGNFGADIYLRSVRA